MESLINSLIFFILGAFVSFTIAEKRILASFGSQEMQDYNAIKDLEQKIIDCHIDIEKEIHQEESNEKLKEFYNRKLEILNAQYRSTFEILCERYLTKGKKIDKENFRKMYKPYIIDLVENNKIKYNINSEFEATIKVYEEFKFGTNCLISENQKEKSII